MNGRWGWALWRQPTALIGYVLASEVVAVGLTIVLVLHTDHSVDDSLRFALLCGLAVFDTEASRTAERARRLHVSVISVWIFAAVLLLPADLAGLLVIVILLHLWLRIWRRLGTRQVYRVVFSVAIFLLSTYAAAGVIAIGRLLRQRYDWQDLLAVVASMSIAALVFLGVNQLLVVIAASLHGPPERRLLSKWECALEIGALCLGGLVGIALSVSPYYAVLVMPPLLVLHRGLLVKQLEEMATTDQKTGLSNMVTWQEQARQELARADRHGCSFGVLMMDLDHFKQVNDTYGHLAGDEVLSAVARMLESEIRDCDSAGRFGGEEFAVLIRDATTPEVLVIAERLRHRVSELVITASTDTGPRVILGLTASVGVAVYPTSGTTLEQLLLTADSAVYTAKSNGRNQVCSAT